VDADAVTAVVADQLGRIERMNARKALERLPGLLERGERVERLGVGELPRAEGSRWWKGKEMAVVVVTDRRLLIVGERREDALPFAAIGTVLGEHRMTGGRFTVAGAEDDRRIELGAFQPQGRAAELADLVRERRP
jgi:hypothetical protein